MSEEYNFEPYREEEMERFVKAYPYLHAVDQSSEFRERKWNDTCSTTRWTLINHRRNKEVLSPYYSLERNFLTLNEESFDLVLARVDGHSDREPESLRGLMDKLFEVREPVREIWWDPSSLVPRKNYDEGNLRGRVILSAKFWDFHGKITTSFGKGKDYYYSQMSGLTGRVPSQ